MVVQTTPVKGSNMMPVVLLVVGIGALVLLYLLFGGEDVLTKEQQEVKLKMMKTEALIKERELEIKKQVLADMEASITAKAVTGEMYRDYNGTGDDQYWVQVFRDKEYGGIGDGRDYEDFDELKIGDERILWSQRNKDGKALGDEPERFVINNGWAWQSMIINQNVILVFKCVYGPGYADYHIVEKKWDTQKALDLQNDFINGLFDDSSQSPKMSEAIEDVMEGVDRAGAHENAKIILRFQTSYQDVSGPGEGRYPMMIFKYVRYAHKLGSMGAGDDGMHEKWVDYGASDLICSIDHGYKKYIDAKSLRGSQLQGGKLVFDDLQMVKPALALFQDINWHYNAVKIIPGSRIYLKVTEELYTMKKIKQTTVGAGPENYEFELPGFTKIEDYDIDTDDGTLTVMHTYENLEGEGSEKIPYIIEKRVSLVPKKITNNIPNLKQWLESAKDIDDTDHQWPMGMTGYIRYKPTGELRSARSYEIYLMPEEDQTETEATFKQKLSEAQTAERTEALEKINKVREENGLEPFPEL